jgi:hypothetical protein
MTRSMHRKWSRSISPEASFSKIQLRQLLEFLVGDRQFLV